MKTLFLKTVSLLFIFMLFSCSKDGATGATGATGPSGANGNANVIGTTDYTIQANDWLSSGNTKYVNLINNSITQSIVNSGIVMIYQKSSTSSSYTPLPFSYLGFNSTFSFSLNSVQLQLSYNNGSAFTISSSMTIRAVIISASNKMANPNVNWNNYEEVKDVFKLKD